MPPKPARAAAPCDYSYAQLVCHRLQFPIDDFEPSRFIKAISGVIHLTNEDGGLAQRVGTFAIITVDVENAINERVPIDDVFDATATTWSYFEALYRMDALFKTKVSQVLWGEERFEPNLLILDRIVIRPEHRGHGLGLAALRALCENFRTGMGAVAMKPFPLQFEGATNDARQFGRNVKRWGLAKWKDYPERTAFHRLRRYYRKLGFDLVPGTPFMVRNLEWPFDRT